MLSFQEKIFFYLCISFATFKTGTSFRALFLVIISNFVCYFVFYIIFLLFLVYSINCYQCSGTDSNNPFQCNEFLENDVDLQPTDCATIHNAQYCIKHVGRYEGESLKGTRCNLIYKHINTAIT